MFFFFLCVRDNYLYRMTLKSLYIVIFFGGSIVLRAGAIFRVKN
jgi:hypothetical protein